jgi:tRNA (guanine37-N1)-methyltransferase
MSKSFNVLGSVAIVNFPKDFKLKKKKEFALNLLSKQKNIKTVLGKKGKIKGRLRKISTNYIAGEKTKEVLYKENNCAFRFNVDDTYFSPRLSNERKELAGLIKKNKVVLVMFAGVAPFSLVIAKNSKAKKVYSNEINRIANKYAKLNIELNNLGNKVELVCGDIKKTAKKLNQKFDVIVMPRPQLKDSFLEQAFMLSKKGTIIYYYDFCKVNEINLIVDRVKTEAKKFKKKIKILKKKKAGEIAPYKVRVRIDFKVV